MCYKCKILIVYIFFTIQIEMLMARRRTREFCRSEVGSFMMSILSCLPPRQGYSILCLVEIGQSHVFDTFGMNVEPGAYIKAIHSIAQSLEKIEEFYDSIGGLAGYQLQCLKIISYQRRLVSDTEEYLNKESKVEMLVPPGLDLRSDEAKQATLEGVCGIPDMAEIYPLGGAGDRLGLQCEETGDSLPTAVLPYCGRSLLENLIRDVQGREYLYFRLFGEQCTIPIAVMTSLAKGNHTRVMQLFEANNWFGRRKDAFKLFQQPMVPMVEAGDGKWLLAGNLELVMKPGGHGVIWKLMLDHGVFDWFQTQGKKAAIVRQISNPMAGQDSTLLALSGEGLSENRAFGFASCERVVGAAEGMNVLLKETVRERGETKTSCRITNVEYTEFKRHGIEDKGVNGSHYSLFPANTNVLYLGLDHIKQTIQSGVQAGSTDVILPGMILNLKKKALCINPKNGKHEQIHAGRLECTMQNLADCFGTEINTKEGGDVDDHVLPTFLVYGPRSKVTSSAKRKRKPGSLKIHQTPDGSFYDLQQNAKSMLTMCGMKTPDFGTVQEYLDNGPGFIFLFHPALGPLWEVVSQKLRGGTLHERSEIQLEIAEASIDNLNVNGSFRVISDAVIGKENDNIMYSETECGRISLKNVTVANKGINWSNPHNVYWRHKVDRHESCKIILQGRSEFEAEDVVLSGDMEYVVPDGYRMVITQDVDGPNAAMYPLPENPSWQWKYQIDIDNERIILEKFN